MTNEPPETQATDKRALSSAKGGLTVRETRAFLCYRRNDGGWYAEWLNNHLSEMTYADPSGHSCCVQLYYDKTAPGVSDWKSLHFPSLQASRALIFICTPGVSKDLSQKGRPDWVYEELKWWVRNRRVSPIVIDTTGEGDRWLPQIVTRKWPNINRIDLNREQAEAATAQGRSEFADRLRERVIGGIRESEHATVFEDLERLRKLNRRLTVSLSGAIVFSILAFLAAIAALMFSNEANRQRQSAISRLRVQLASDDAHLVVSAIDQLRNDYGRQIEEVETWIPAEKVSSHKWFALVGAQLQDVMRSRESHGTWPVESIQIMARLISQTNRSEPPPSAAADDALNRRVFVKGGTFSMGDDGQSRGESPHHLVTLSSFLLQEHEVTNAEYRRFEPTHDPHAPNEFPVDQVTWYDAMAYALWVGGSLPTEAQWEFSARGEKGREYPWGDVPELRIGDPSLWCDFANYVGCPDGGIKPVKTGREKGKTPEGVYDLAGNADEWCRDWFGPYSQKHENNPTGPDFGDRRVVRGTYDPPPRGAGRERSRPEDRSAGFRVAFRSVPASR